VKCACALVTARRECRAAVLLSLFTITIHENNEARRSSDTDMKVTPLAFRCRDRNVKCRIQNLRLQPLTVAAVPCALLTQEFSFIGSSYNAPTKSFIVLW
jgi:hypothetical protein